MKVYYGLADIHQNKDFAVKVCDILGYGNGYAIDLLLETAAAETGLGTVKDPTIHKAGHGVTQFDEMPFFDLISRTRQKYKDTLIDNCGLYLDWIEDVNVLEYSPLLAYTMTRLAYIKVPESIPGTIEGRAHYWKRYYNTEAGKGTVEHYVDAATRFRQFIF